MWGKKIQSLEDRSDLSPFFVPLRETKESNCADETEHIPHDVSTFIARLEKGIFILGMELGFLVQGSTLPTQYVTNLDPSPRGQLVFSLGISYLVANVALFIFFFCQKVVQAFLTEISSQQSDHPTTPSKTKEGNDASQDSSATNTLEEWKVDIHCNFALGAVVGVFLSWMCVDLIMNFKTQIVYGGIVFLLSLLIYTAQIWYKQRKLDSDSQQQSQQGSLDIEAVALFHSDHQCKPRSASNVKG